MRAGSMPRATRPSCPTGMAGPLPAQPRASVGRRSFASVAAVRGVVCALLRAILRLTTTSWHTFLPQLQEERMPRIPYQMPGLRNGTAPMQHHRSSMVTGDEARRQRGRRGRVPVATSTQVERKRATAASRAAPPWSAEMLSARTPSASSCLAREAHVKPLGPCYGAQVADTTKWGRPPARATPAKQRRTRMRAARRRGAAAGAAPRRPRRRAGRARWPSPARRQASFRAVPGAPTSMLRRCPAQARSAGSTTWPSARPPAPGLAARTFANP